ncbi:8-amino-7-oxononanoate synthase [Pseudoduganella plicata]|uniref:8-amino-7-oxononanoate synthase n=1 Tax=Pseudoduganella plicata TaxID=321984 RepID=A0A4P7BH62_9BURK|nr:8-amino-7-oxononanoate synthase [Pseudoduganella plicata]QBQ37603.1 8-amino-7-oxononanoate synthase [Pseudoduganella plicata]GGY91622.1 8-amino-7-oxononanoate synthase [Pseudoduganella plicata]
MELLKKLDAQLRALDEQSLIRVRKTVETPCGPRVIVDGRPMLAFCSNDYLGLAAHPAIAAALQEGAARYGTGSGASHLISGHSRAHVLLEERLAAFESAYLVEARALSFCTGYMANLAVITGLASVDRNTEIFSEALNHASLIDGARLARTSVKVYPHADVEALAVLLEQSSATNKIVVTDSVFSMDGDLAPLPALLALCERHNAWLIVDDAHGFGTLGENGHGALEHFRLRSPNLVYMGTLGKAAGVGGAFVAAHKTVIETLIQRARPYIFTTAAPPVLAHALLTSLDIIEGEEGRHRRSRLAALVAQWQDGLTLRRWQPLASQTAIQPIVIGRNDETMHAAAALYEQGIWVGGIRPPTVPAGTARLRVTFSAAHTTPEVAQLIAALNQLERT